ncbi:hypothetical protein K439DRAFT_1369235, partial [Ramaria rubella]
KYTLATISQLLETLPKGVGLGYDIMCSFWSTIMRSSLGPQARQLGLRMVVPAFHGHAHNRLCHLCFHIQISQGFGIEDLETCERTFSGSNAVAQLTQHSMPYHRCQFIDLFFRQWDSEKYENLGIFLANFMFNDYTQALEFLQDMPVHIDTLTSGQNILEAQYAGWLSDEHQYLESKKLEPEIDVLGVEYVRLLTKYSKAPYLLNSELLDWHLTRS